MSHLNLPSAAAPLVESFAAAFSKPTFARFVVLLVGAVLALGRRTVTNIFWTVRGVADGDVSSYHRVLSRARWSLWPLAKIVAAALLGVFSVVALIYAEHLRGHKPAVRSTPWYEKDEPTFADALATIRRLFWSCTFLQQPAAERAWKTLPADLRDAVLGRLCYAA